jgi:hypothetical protein
MASSDLSSDLLARNRVILMHFDTYSASLSFVRWDDETMLWPDALPDWSDTPAPADAASAAYDGEAVRQALIARYDFKPAELVRLDFDYWAQTEGGPVRIHLLRFNTFQAPKALLEACDGSFQNLPELRGADKQELQVLRQVFNLFIGGGRHG